MSIDSFASIRVTGPDAFDFLQAQLAADVRDAGSDAPLLSAWCNPKGRVVCLLRALRDGDGFLLSLPAELADEVLERLRKFRFRSKVEFAVEAALPAHIGMTGAFEDWQLDNLRAGIVHIGSAQSEAFTPHMLNLDLVGAVSLDKGCYPGQEIVARTHYRGATKRRCLRFESTAPASAGDKVSDGTRDVGEVVNAIGTDLLAIVPIGSGGNGLAVGDDALRHVLLEYLRPHMRE